jgi:hypothetical protein
MRSEGLLFPKKKTILSNALDLKFQRKKTLETRLPAALLPGCERQVLQPWVMLVTISVVKKVNKKTRISHQSVHFVKTKNVGDNNMKKQRESPSSQISPNGSWIH